MKPRPTDAEFEVLKQERDEAVRKVVEAACARNGWDPVTVRVHVSHAGDCYCACPDGPCQHVWDGPEYASEDRCLFSTTCSRCGAVAAFHDMRCAP